MPYRVLSQTAEPHAHAKSSQFAWLIVSSKADFSVDGRSERCDHPLRVLCRTNGSTAPVLHSKSGSNEVETVSGDTVHGGMSVNEEASSIGQHAVPLVGGSEYRLG
jgi:hypothetical protein